MDGYKMKLTKACVKLSHDTGNAEDSRPLDCIADNLASSQIHREINPFSQARSNLSTMMNKLNGSKTLKWKMPNGLKLTIDEKLLREIEEELAKSRLILSIKSKL